MLRAPFPYFGGKSSVADEVWKRFGDTNNYVEPFAGSLAVLLKRPTKPRTETVNDINGFLANFWRSLKHDPETVMRYSDWPINEIDLTAIHLWLVERMAMITEKMFCDPEYYDAKIAGRWVWGASAWIGHGWCSGDGPWRIEGGHLMKMPRDRYKEPETSEDSGGVSLRRPHLSDSGTGINAKHFSRCSGVAWQRPDLGDRGRGVCRKSLLRQQGVKRVKPLLSVNNGINTQRYTYDWATELAKRLRWTRVCCGDWSRVVTPSVTTRHGLTSVFLDPPYLHSAGRAKKIYSSESATVAEDVRKWAIENGDNPLFRIALCGYEGEHEMPETWECFAWNAHGGMASVGDENRHRERIWFSPHCLKQKKAPRQRRLF